MGSPGGWGLVTPGTGYTGGHPRDCGHVITGVWYGKCGNPGDCGYMTVGTGSQVCHHGKCGHVTPGAGLGGVTLETVVV